MGRGVKPDGSRVLGFQYEVPRVVEYVIAGYALAHVAAVLGGPVAAGIPITGVAARFQG